MNKTHSRILAASLIHIIAGFIFIYYLKSFPLAVIALLTINFLSLRRILAKNTPREVVLRIIQPSLFLVLVEAYYFVSTAITGERLLAFIFMMLAAVCWQATLIWSELTPEKREWIQSVEIAVLIFFSANITSLLIANWNLPLALVLAAYIMLNVFFAIWWLARLARNVNFLALIWGLAAGELIWISSHWLIFYQVPVLRFLVSQNSLLITTLAYSWGGIYTHYKNQQLSRRIVFEYLFVLVIVVMVLLILTRWRVF